MNIINYEHHGVKVSVFEELKGKHREHCLCWHCAKFHPGDREKNCKIACVLYELNRLAEVTTPVYECMEFVFKGK